MRQLFWRWIQERAKAFQERLVNDRWIRELHRVSRQSPGKGHTRVCSVGCNALLLDEAEGRRACSLGGRGRRHARRAAKGGLERYEGGITEGKVAWHVQRSGTERRRCASPLVLTATKLKAGTSRYLMPPVLAPLYAAKLHRALFRAEKEAETRRSTGGCVDGDTPAGIDGEDGGWSKRVGENRRLANAMSSMNAQVKRPGRRIHACTYVRTVGTHIFESGCVCTKKRA